MDHSPPPPPSSLHKSLSVPGPKFWPRGRGADIWRRLASQGPRFGPRAVLDEATSILPIALEIGPLLFIRD